VASLGLTPTPASCKTYGRVLRTFFGKKEWDWKASADGRGFVSPMYKSGTQDFHTGNDEWFDEDMQQLAESWESVTSDDGP
jgi:hypothetical protein